MKQPNPGKPYRPRVAAFTGWTIFFFVLLRVAIGWHFLYEGFWKVRDGNFSATPYLLASQGPLKPIFRWMVFDADGFKRLDPQFQVDRLEAAKKRITAFYDLTPDQQKVLDGWITARSEDLMALNMPADEIQKLRTKFSERLSSYVARFGDTLGEIDALSSSPRDTVIAALDRMRQNNVSELPVFDNDQLVGVVHKAQLETATSQPAGGTPDLKIEKLLPPPDPEIKQFARALLAADFQNALESYKQLLGQVASEEANMDPKFKAQRLDYNQQKVTKARSALLARVEQPMNLVDSVGTPAPPPPAPQPPDLKLTPKQLLAGPVPAQHLTEFPYNKLNHQKVGRLIELRFPPKTLTKYIDLMMMFGLVLIGVCLILGLFTRFAALCAIMMLAMFYLSMPPWPGTVDPPNVEGHYFFVNKNLIELIACLMIMTSRVGRWCGLDAFLGAMSDRRRRQRAEREAVQFAQASKDSVYVTGDARSVREPARL